MIRLVATDIDGTLVKDSTPHLYGEMKQMVKTLVSKGIYFAAASGRDYPSIRRMFAEVADDIIFLSANGACIMYKGKQLKLSPIEPMTVKEIITDCRLYTKTGMAAGMDYVCELSASTASTNLLESTNQEYIDLIHYGYRNQYAVVEDILKETDPLVKISLYHKGGIEELGRKLIPEWNGRVKATMAGSEWVDFMDRSVDKGNALQFLQEYFQIKKEETMAFGDNGNDVGMIKAAGRGYAVPNAVPEVKAAAGYTCPGYEDKGVWRILQEEFQCQ